jgi:release factor glutamine methyltransferase
LDTARTINDALAQAAAQLRATSETPRLDAELLLAHALGWPRARLLAEGRAPLPAEQAATFRELVARRQALEPVAYIVGHKEFYGLDFAVDRRVLVPRPETELLVELVLGFARRRTTDHQPPTTDQVRLETRDLRLESTFAVQAPSPKPQASSATFVGRRSSIVVADVGTGSGCIAVALAVYLPGAEVWASDSSPDALDVARQNVARHGVASRVRLAQGDLLAPLDRQADLIVSNPPYTILGEIDEGVRRHEPRGALDGGPDGLELYRRLLAQAPRKLTPGGAVLLEIGATQGQAVSVLARQHFPNAEVRLHKDLAGLDRVVTIDTLETGDRRQVAGDRRA